MDVPVPPWLARGLRSRQLGMALVLESRVPGVPWGWEVEVRLNSSLWEGQGEQDSSQATGTLEGAGLWS